MSNYILNNLIQTAGESTITCLCGPPFEAIHRLDLMKIGWHLIQAVCMTQISQCKQGSAKYVISEQTISFNIIKLLVQAASCFTEMTLYSEIS